MPSLDLKLCVSDMAMRKIKQIWVSHKDAPAVSGPITLKAWSIPENVSDETKLLEYLEKELINLWLVCNGESVAGWSMPRKELLKYFWSKRPTRVTISYSDGGKTRHEINVPKELYYSLDRNFGDNHYIKKAA